MNLLTIGRGENIETGNTSGFLSGYRDM